MGEKGFCTCMCHQDGVQAQHTIPCCDLMNEKYIDKNGKIDHKRLEEARKKKQNKKSNKKKNEK